MIAPTLLGYRLPFPGDEGRGGSYRGTASLFWLLGDPAPTPLGHQPSAKLAVLSPQEKGKLAATLAETLDRLTYLGQKFDAAVSILIERKRQVGGTITYDAFGSQLYDLLGYILTTARSFVDHVVYVSARLAGQSDSKADRWSVEDMKGANTPEARILIKHQSWFDLLNSYRNALVHRGQRNSFGGFFPRGCILAEAKNPRYNVMLLPDFNSIQRPNRPHQWTYNQGTRIEDLVAQISQGLDAFALEIGQEWGGYVPPDAQIPYEEHPNILVVSPNPALILLDDIAIIAIFTDQALADQFRTRAMNGTEHAEPFEICPCHQMEEPTFVFCMSPDDIGRLKQEGIKKIWILRNPNPGANEYKNFVIKESPISDFDALTVADDKIMLLAKSFPGIDKLYIIRTVPEYLRH